MILAQQIEIKNSELCLGKGGRYGQCYGNRDAAGR